MGFNDELEQFNKELDDFMNDIPEQAIQLQKKVVLEVLRRVVLRTAVDEGRARGDWQVTIGKPATSTAEEFKKVDSPEKSTEPPGLDVAGDEVIQKGLEAISNLPPYQVVFISNNVEYIEFLEEGSSDQAPDGMVKVTVEELRQMFK